jgi:hypothetical protein
MATFLSYLKGILTFQRAFLPYQFPPEIPAERKVVKQISTYESLIQGLQQVCHNTLEMAGFMGY